MPTSSFLRSSTPQRESGEARDARLAAERAALDDAYAQARSEKGMDLDAFNLWCDDLIAKIPD